MSIRDAARRSRGHGGFKGEKRLVSRWRRDGWQEAPTSESFHKRINGSWDNRGCISSAPLVRLLEQSVGMKWTDIKDKIPKEQMDNFDWLLLTDVQDNGDGLFSTRGWCRHAYFVNKNGILMSFGDRRRYRYKELPYKVIEIHKRASQSGFITKKVDEADLVSFEGNDYVRRHSSGLWYLRKKTGTRLVSFWDIWKDKIQYRKEDVFKDFQVNGKLQKRLNQHIRDLLAKAS